MTVEEERGKMLDLAIGNIEKKHGKGTIINSEGKKREGKWYYDLKVITKLPKKIPKRIDIRPGTIIIEKFDIPKTFIAVTSSLFLIFKKNHIPDRKTMKGNIL